MADVDGCREEFASASKLQERGWVRDEDHWRHKKWSPKKPSVTFKEAQDTVCGAIIRMRIMQGLKPLGDCIDRITRQAEKGFLVGLDGRKLHCRSTHSALNLKLQSTGAILMKTGLVHLMNRLEKEGLVKIGKDYEPDKYVELFTFYHDEYQLGVPLHLCEDTKVIPVDFSEFDLTTKKGKKAAEGKVEKMAKRFQNRERRKTGKAWSEPKVDFEKGTITMVYCKVGQMCVETFEEMGKFFNMDCPIDGNYMIGDNWHETH